MNPASLINLQPGHAHMMAVCEQYGVTRDELRAADKRAHIVDARADLCFRAVIIAGLSTSRTGRLVCKDHTTVLYNVRRKSRELFGTPPKAPLEEIREAWHAAQMGRAA